MKFEQHGSYPIHNVFADQNDPTTRYSAFIVPNQRFLFIANHFQRASLITDRGLPVPTYLNWFEQNAEVGTTTAFYHGTVVVFATLTRGYAISARLGEYQLGQKIIRDGPDLIRFLQECGVTEEDASIIRLFGVIRKPDPWWMRALRIIPIVRRFVPDKPQYYPWKAWRGEYLPAPSPWT